MDEYELTFDKNTVGLEGREMLNGVVLSPGIVGSQLLESFLSIVDDS